MRRVLAVTIAVCVAAPAMAQPVFPVSVDQRVRVTIANDTTVVGRVSAVAADGFQIAGEDGKTYPVGKSGISRIEVSRGRASKWKQYALRGAIISGVIGAISLGLQHDDVGENGSSVGKAAALGVWSGGLFGGLIGGAIGAAKSADRWETVWP